MTLTLKLEPTLEQRLREQAARRGLDPDSYAVAAIEEKLRLDSQAATRLSHDESELLSQISTGLATETWDRYDNLHQKRRDEALTPTEHEELMRLTNVIEEDHARRIALVCKLARIRNVPALDARAGNRPASIRGGEEWLSGRSGVCANGSPRPPTGVANTA